MLPPKEKLQLMSSLVHAADISNSFMEFDSFKNWGLRIVQEFDDLF